MGSFNGGGTFWVGSDFATNELGASPPSWRSKYMREFSEAKFAQNLPSWLVARRLELQTLVESDASYGPELDRVSLFLTDLDTHFAEASAYVKSGKIHTGASKPQPE
jgi:hypothetical protein